MRGKNWKRMAAAGISAAMAFGLLTGCGSSAGSNPEKIFKAVEEALEGEKSVKQEYEFTMELEESGESMEVELDINSDITMDPVAAHGTGEFSVELDGTSESMQIETYAVDGELYTSFDDVWARSDLDYDLDSAILNFGELADHASNFKITDKNDEVEGETCVTMEGSINAKSFADVWQSAGSAGANLATLIDALGVSDATKIPMTVSIYKDSKLPAQVEIDLSEVAGNLALEDESVGEFEVTLMYTDYGKADEDIEVPDDVTGSAFDSEADIFNMIFGDIESETDGDTDDDGKFGQAVEQSADLGDSWTDYTIQIGDKVLTLPCTYDDIVAAGFTLDDTTDPETVVNKESTWYGYFERGQGSFDYFGVTFYNPSTEEAKVITDCTIIAISVDYYAEEDGLSVVLPGGITFSSTRDDIIAAYGEPDNLYEGDTFDFLTYYDGDSYTKSLEFSIDKETNTVWDLDLSCD